MRTVIRNNDEYVSMINNRHPVTVKFDDGDEVSITPRHTFRIASNLRLKIDNYVYSTEMSIREVKKICKKLNLEFRPLNFHKIAEEPKGLLAMEVAGYGPEAEGWDRQNGLAFWGKGRFRNDMIKPQCLKAAHEESARQIAEAQSFWNGRLGTDDPYQLVQWHIRATETTPEFFPTGQAAILPWQGSSYFGSGGAWGNWIEIGQPEIVEVDNKDNGFVKSGSRKVIFTQPGQAVYTAAGDGIGGSREFYRRLVVSE